MNTLEAVYLLRRHNRWRRGDNSVSMVATALLGCAIDVVCDHAERHDEIVASLSTLVAMLNRDKDGSYFLCEEAAGYVDEARAILAKVGEP